MRSGGLSGSGSYNTFLSSWYICMRTRRRNEVQESFSSAFLHPKNDFILVSHGCTIKSGFSQVGQQNKILKNDRGQHSLPNSGYNPPPRSSPHEYGRYNIL